MQTTNTQTAAQDIATVAAEHFGANGSALIAYQDATSLIDQGLYQVAAYRALTSLAHSCGVYSQEHMNAEALLLLAILADRDLDPGSYGYTQGQMQRIRERLDATDHYLRQLRAAVAQAPVAA